MKQKVKNQGTRAVDGGQDYTTYMEMNSRARDGDAPESFQANPDNLSEGAGYWAVDETTQHLQARVRLMLEKAKQVLTDRQYNAFVLIDLKHLKLREAAKVMEINFSRVDQLIKRARLKLQKVYTEQTGD